MDYIGRVDWDAVRGHLWALTQVAAANPAAVLHAAPGIAAVAVGVLALLLMRPKYEPLYGGPQPRPLPPISTKRVKPRGSVYIPLALGNVTIDLQPKMTETLHVVIGGTTRTGKSTSVLPLFDLPIGVLCVALDMTAPIEAKVRAVGGTVWTNDPAECSIGLDILNGPARIVSEGLVAGFPKSIGNVGDYQRSARDVIWSALEEMDELGVARNLPDIVLALLRPMPDGEAQRACRSWARKLSSLVRIIGPTLGTDLDVVQAMRRGETVLLKLNHFLSPDDAPFIAGILLVLARRVMEQAGVPFVLIIEEAGQAAIAQGHLSPIAQAGAARGAPLVVLTQNMSTLPLEVRNNLSVTVSFTQEDDTEQRIAAQRLNLKPEQLRREAFKDKGVGWCYARAPGIPTTLVRIKQQRPSKAASALTPPVVGPSVGPSARTVVDTGWSVVERPMVDGWQPWPPSLPEPRIAAILEPVPTWVVGDKDMERMWRYVRRTGMPRPLWSPEHGLWWDERGCLEWQKGKTQSGQRGRSTIKLPGQDRQEVLVYREFYFRATGVRPDPTFDHWCDNPSCVDWLHGEPCTIGENNARRPLRETAFTVAWAARAERSAESAVA